MSSTALRIPPSTDYGRPNESVIYVLWSNYQKHLENTGQLDKSESRLDKIEKPWHDKAERYVCGYPLPDFQRGLKWTEEMNIKFVTSVWMGGHLGTYMFHAPDWENDGTAMRFSGWLLDGQQRLNAIERYWRDEFKVFGLLWSELTQSERRRFFNTKFASYEVELWDEQKIRDAYNLHNFGGVAHQEHEYAGGLKDPKIREVMWGDGSEQASLVELWDNVAKISKGRADDNHLLINHNENYPLSLRVRQLESLKHCIAAIENHHSKLIN